MANNASSVATMASIITRVTNLEVALQEQIWLNGNLSAALLQVNDTIAPYNECLDTIWILLTGYLVWFMSAGFAFLELGGVRQKNSQNILAKNIFVPVLTFVGWYFLGYPLGFGSLTTRAPSNFIGQRFFTMDGFYQAPTTTFKYWFFQGAFADTTASIVSGGIAERMTLVAFLIHTVVMTSFIYPVCVYWAWSGSGWLNFPDPNTGVMKSLAGPWYQDWAGSGVIHLVGGTAALVGAIMVGPRKGRFDPNVDQDAEFVPHSVPFTVLGTFILWFGWYGFNPGSVGHMNNQHFAENTQLVVINTTLAPCCGGLVAFILRATVFPPRTFDVPALCNGILAGLVAVTAPCGYIEPWEAIIIGAMGGLFYCTSAWLVAKAKIDDPIEAVSVHFTNGLWGAISCGLFGDPLLGFGGNGCFRKQNGAQLAVQIAACLCFMLWSASLTILVFLPLKLAGRLRWSDEFQELGADEMQHSPRKSYLEHSPPKNASAEGSTEKAIGNVTYAQA